MKRGVKILDRLITKHAVIMAQAGEGEGYVAVPFGDKRRRPVSWIKPELLNEFLSQGVVQKDGDHYIIVESYKRRHHASRVHGKMNASANQHRTLETRHIYNPDKVKRSVSVNTSVSVFKKLSTQRDTKGRPYLSADEVEAGDMFSRDYSSAYGSNIGTQSYSGMSVSRDRAHNCAEDISIHMLDRQKRSRAALQHVGPGLDQTLIALCGREWGLERLEAEQGWPKRSAKIILKLALARLSAFYGCKPGVKPLPYTDL
jgi:hypothetical protein